MIAACFALMNEVWNPYGSQSIELVGGVGAMRNKRGEIVEESLLRTEAWEFKVGFRPPIWCFIDAEGEVTLSKYSAQYESFNSLPPKTP